VRDTVSQTTLVEAGALGLGAITMAVVGSAAADVTGLLAAGTLASLGLYLLPLKRRRLVRQFREQTEVLRQALNTSLRREFEQSLSTSLSRVRTALGPYTHFLEEEQQRLDADSQQLDTLLERARALRARVTRDSPPLPLPSESAGPV
jgi:hypothetical protein